MSKKPHKDSQGQIGGPTDAEQARADEEQRALMEQRARDYAPVREAESRARQAKIDASLRSYNELKNLVTLVKDLERRMTALENK